MPALVSYTFAQLQAALIAATEEDATFSTAYVAEIPNIIRKGETRCYSDLNFEIFDRVRTGALTPNVFIQAIKPATWQGTRSIFLLPPGGAGARQYLRRRSYEYCVEFEPDIANVDTPLYFAEYSDTQFFMSPPPDVAYAYELREISRDTALSVVTTISGTWLSLNLGDLLFAACMVESERWLQGSAEDIGTWEVDYRAKLDVHRATLRGLIRAEQSPVQNAPRTVEDKP